MPQATTTRSRLEGAGSGRLLTVSVRQPISQHRSHGGKRRIGFVCYGMGGGGVERWIANLVQVTKDRFEWMGIGAEDFILERAKTQIGQVPFFNGVDACVQLAKKCDLLIVWLSSNVHRYKFESKAKLIGTHHSGPCEFTWGMNAKVHWDLLDGVHSCSHYATTSLPDSVRDRAVVIHNCVASETVEPVASPDEVFGRHRLPRHQAIVTFIGRLSAEKRWGLAVSGASMVPGTHAVVAGGSFKSAFDPYMPGILDAFSPRASYIGWQHHVGDVLQISDMLVAPSDRHEACQYTVMEACLAGIPVITTPYGIVHDRPELACRILPERPTPEYVATAIRETLSDMPAARAHAAKSREIMEREFNMGIWKRNWIKFLEEF